MNTTMLSPENWLWIAGTILAPMAAAVIWLLRLRIEQRSGPARPHLRTGIDSSGDPGHAGSDAGSDGCGH